MIKGKCLGCGLTVSVTERVAREAPRAMCVGCHGEVEWLDLNQPDGPRAPLVPLPRYSAVPCPVCPAWEERRRYMFETQEIRVESDCPACGGLRFVKVDVDALRAWPS